MQLWYTRRHSTLSTAVLTKHNPLHSLFSRPVDSIPEWSENDREPCHSYLDGQRCVLPSLSRFFHTSLHFRTETATHPQHFLLLIEQNCRHIHCLKYYGFTDLNCFEQTPRQKNLWMWYIYISVIISITQREKFFFPWRQRCQIYLRTILYFYVYGLSDILELLWYP